MSTRLFRLSGVAAIACGVLTALFWLVHPVAADPHATRDAAYWAAVQSGRFTAVNGMFVVILVACLFGLIGAHARQFRQVGGAGLVGFALAFSGTAVFIAAAAFTAFVVPVLAASETTRPLLDERGPLFGGPLAALFVVGGLAFAVGFVLLGIQTFRRGVLPRLAGLLLVVSSPILGLSPLMPFLARAIGSLLFGIAFVWLGKALWATPDEVSS